MADFVHLHVHSHYSLLTGLPKIKELVKAAKERGFKALALTDYGSMYGMIQFYEKCREEGIKPILGCEFYLALGSRFDKRAKIDMSAYHLVLLAETFEGYQNIMRMSSIGHLEGFYYRPRIDKEVLRQYSKGTIALSGCMGGEIPQLIHNGAHPEKINTAIKEYQEIFGVENFFLELQDHPEKEGQVEVNNALIIASKETGAPLVVTRDVHYLNTDDAEAQDILTCIKDGKTLDQPGRFSMRHIDRSFNTGDDIASRFQHIPSALENTVKIADRCNVEIPLDLWHFPDVKLPEGKTAEMVLGEMVTEGLTRRYQETNETLKTRADYELGIINQRGFAPYFLAVADYLAWSKANGIITTTRGSAAGSIVSYCIGITSVDPMRFKLPFERFLNPFRPSPPDVDGDFADYRRDEVIKYVTDKYGDDKVAQICTFGTMAARASIRDVGRALGYSYGMVDKIAKLVPMGSQGFPMTISRALELAPEFADAYKKSEEVKRMIHLAQKIEGCARHISVHAAGVVIAPEPLTNFTPLQREPGGDKIITQYEMKSVEKAGILKMDFLGLRNLSILEEALRYIKKTRDIDIVIEEIPYDDAQTFEMLGRGETVGVFQLGGSGMTHYLKELRPTVIDDIMAMVALYRPGPMESIPEYIARKNDPSLITFPDERLREVLSASYGVLTYQDDVLLTSIELAGYTWGEADKLRKAMGKKIPAEMAKQKEKFIQGVIDNGATKSKAEEVWKLIEPFAAYGFNKCLPDTTRIFNPHSGEYISIRELLTQKKKLYVSALNDSFKFETQRASSIVSNGKKKVWRVITRSGRTIEATANHPFRTFEGWSHLNSLKKGTRIAVPRILHYTPTKRITRAQARALGYLLSEGNLCHPSGIYFYSKSELEIKDFCNATKGFSNVQCTIDRSKPAIAVYVRKKDLREDNGLFKWCKSLGILGKKATEKNIPPMLFSVTRAQLAECIGTMWQGDGCIFPKKDGQIFYATSSKQLVEDLQHLLLRFGIISTIYTKKFRYRGGYKIGYTLNISRYTNIELFAKWIGPYLIGTKKKMLAEIVRRNKIISGGLSKSAARGTPDTIPVAVYHLLRKDLENHSLSMRDIAKRIGVSCRLFMKDTRRKGYLRETIQKIGKYIESPTLLNLGNSEVYWDEIKSIEYVGNKDTYDLSIPDLHNFVANDFVVHNSHACSYGMVAYHTAYIKAHYPGEYMAALLSCEYGDLDTVAQYVVESRKMGIPVLPPDVNESFKLFGVIDALTSPRIRFGLGAVKNVGEHIAEVIIETRKNGGSFKNLEDFIIRVRDKDLNKKSLESLIKAGALDAFGERFVLLGNIENLLNFSREVGEIIKAQQNSLFGGGGYEGMRVRLDPVPEVDEAQRLQWEKELLGLYISKHPCVLIAHELDDRVKTVAVMKKEAETETEVWVCVVGVVGTIKKFVTKKGDMMAFAVIEDATGSVEIVLFPRTYEECNAILVDGAMLAVLGKRDAKDGEIKLLAERVEKVTPGMVVETINHLYAPKGEEIQMNTVPESTSEPILATPALVITITPDNVPKLETLRTHFNERPGPYNVYVRIVGGTGNKLIATGMQTCISPELTTTISELVGSENMVLRE